jgi:hypothetical protein
VFGAEDTLAGCLALVRSVVSGLTSTVTAPKPRPLACCWPPTWRRLPGGAGRRSDGRTDRRGAGSALVAEAREFVAVARRVAGGQRAFRGRRSWTAATPRMSVAAKQTPQSTAPWPLTPGWPVAGGWPTWRGSQGVQRHSETSSAELPRLRAFFPASGDPSGDFDGQRKLGSDILMTTARVTGG